MPVVLRVVLIGCIALQIVLAGAEDTSFYAARRKALMNRIEGSVAVLRGASEPDSYTVFRQDNNFYYLTGVEAPGAVLLLDGISRESLLFLPPRDEDREQWDGPQLFAGPEAGIKTGIRVVHGIDDFEDELRKRTCKARQLYTPLSPMETAAMSRDRARRHEISVRADAWDGRISRGEAFTGNLQARLGAVKIADLSGLLDDMRRIKDAQEIGRLRESGRIGAEGMKEAIRSVRPGMYEYQAAAVAHFVFLWRGASGFAFHPIVGSGPNSCVLHYSLNNRSMAQGDLVVMDFGPDYQYYASDITRTFPVSGRFTAGQAKAYRVVLEAEKAAIAKIRPGASFSELESAVRDVLARHRYADYLPHAVSHYIGMSTHDVGDSEKFEPGVVIAIEPGIYIPERNLGIRIEDTVLVTREGCEILTNDVPRELAEIESLMTEKGIGDVVVN